MDLKNAGELPSKRYPPTKLNEGAIDTPKKSDTYHSIKKTKKVQLV